MFDKDKAGLALISLVAVLLSVVLSSPVVGALIFLLGLAKYLPRIIMKNRGRKHPDTIEVRQRKSIFRAKLGFWSAATTVMFALFLFFFRPWFHDIVMAVYKQPAFFLFVFSAVMFWLFLHLKQIRIAWVFAASAALFFIVMLFAPVIMQCYIVRSTDYIKISSLPDSDQLRLVPQAVARRYLEDSLQKSYETVGQLDIVNIWGSPKWTAPRIPDGFILYLTQGVNGLLFADASSTDRKTSMVSQAMPVGEGIGITDNIYWKLFKKKYFVDIDEVYYVLDGNSVITLANVIKYRLRFPVMVPYFAGIYVVRGSEIQYVEAKDVPGLEYLKGNWAYPERLARLYVDSYKYHLGVWNAWFLHKDQIEITDVYGQNNQQPFLMPTVDGMKWMVATEPYGRSYGVFKIFVVDALTGRIEMLELDEDSTLTGPVSIVSYVKKKFPTIDWGTARIIEPRPYIIHGELYWMLSITPYDFAGITYTVLANAGTNEIIGFVSDADVEAFVMRGVYTQSDQLSDNSPAIRRKISEIEEKLAELKSLV